MELGSFIYENWFLNIGLQALDWEEEQQILDLGSIPFHTDVMISA